MKKIKFKNYKNKDLKLTSRDIEILNDFFNKPKNIEILSQIEDDRKKAIRSVRIIFGIIVLIALGFNLTNFNKDMMLVSVFYLLFFLLVIYIILKAVLPKFLMDKTIKKDLIGDFVKYIDKNIDFSSDSKLFPETIDEIKNKTGLISSYDRVKSFEDSIKYDYIINNKNEKTKTIQIWGVELRTEDRHTDSEGRTSRSTSDHCYITKLKFLHPRFEIDESIRLDEDVYNFMGGIVNYVPYILGFLLLGFLVLIFTSQSFSIDGNFIIVGLFLIGFYLIFKYKTANRVVLENKKFEEIFDVYCDDGIEARKVLTPALMNRILEFIENFPKQSYEFYLYKDEIYIKQKLSKNYLEFDISKNVFENIQDYVVFYKQIKQTKNLIKNLGLYYYDKESFSKQRNN